MGESPNGDGAAVEQLFSHRWIVVSDEDAAIRVEEEGVVQFSDPDACMYENLPLPMYQLPCLYADAEAAGGIEEEDMEIDVGTSSLLEQLQDQRMVDANLGDMWKNGTF